jgi:hypothetical protein
MTSGRQHLGGRISDGRMRTVSYQQSPRTPCCTRLQEVWYALVANSEFMFNDAQNEALAEQLREKKRFYGEQVRCCGCCCSSASHSDRMWGRRPARVQIWPRLDAAMVESRHAHSLRRPAAVPANDGAVHLMPAAPALHLQNGTVVGLRIWWRLHCLCMSRRARGRRSDACCDACAE